MYLTSAYSKWWYYFLRFREIYCTSILTHMVFFMDQGKQCRPRSDTAECSVWLCLHCLMRECYIKFFTTPKTLLKWKWTGPIVKRDAHSALINLKFFYPSFYMQLTSGAKQTSWKKVQEYPVTVAKPFPSFQDNCCLHSHLLMYFGGLDCKQYEPWSDCSCSLIRFHIVCF